MSHIEEAPVFLYVEALALSFYSFSLFYSALEFYKV